MVTEFPNTSRGLFIRRRHPHPPDLSTEGLIRAGMATPQPPTAFN